MWYLSSEVYLQTYPAIEIPLFFSPPLSSLRHNVTSDIAWQSSSRWTLISVVRDVRKTLNGVRFDSCHVAQWNSSCTGWLSGPGGGETAFLTFYYGTDGIDRPFPWVIRCDISWIYLHLIHVTSRSIYYATRWGVLSQSISRWNLYDWADFPIADASYFSFVIQTSPLTVTPSGREKSVTVSGVSL